MKINFKKIKEQIAEYKVLVIVIIWILSVIGYKYLWWNVFSFTMRTGVIILALIIVIPLIIVGLIKKFSLDAWKGYTVLCLLVMFALAFLADEQTPISNFTPSNYRNTVLAHVRSVDFNVDKLNERLEDGGVRVRGDYSIRWWNRRFRDAFVIRTVPNFRFTNQQLEELAVLKVENENLTGRTYDIWISHTHHDDLLRTYNRDISPFTTIRGRDQSTLSTIYGIEENIAVIELGITTYNGHYVLRLPLINQYGELQTDNFELALQLHQIMLGEMAEEYEIGEAEKRPFERAREVLTELREEYGD